MTLRSVFACSLLAIAGCGGASVDREGTLAELRTAIEEETPDETVLDAHNDLVLRVRESDVLQGMRRHEVEEAIGPGQECGNRELCSREGFRPTDLVYEVGRRGSMPFGPTLIVGFDRQGIVDGVYTLTRGN